MHLFFVEFSREKDRKKGEGKLKTKWMIRPMAIPRVILELQDESSRETALRCLSRFLIEIREENPRMYNDAGHMLYYSFGTMSILLQEILAFLRKMVEGSLKYRSIKRIANVLTLIQANRLFVKIFFLPTCVLLESFFFFV